MSVDPNPRPSGVLPNSNSRWRVSDPLPPSAALPLTESKLSCCSRNLPFVRGRRERSERGGRSHIILNCCSVTPFNGYKSLLLCI